MIQPLALRTLSREQLGHFRHLGIVRRSIDFSALDVEWRFRLWADRRAREGLIHIRADWGGAKLLLRVDQHSIESLAARLLDAEYGIGMAEPLRSIVLEAAFADKASLVEEATRKRFSVLAIEEAGELPEDWSGFGFSLEDDEFSNQGELWIDELGLGFLANALRSVYPEPRDIATFDEFPVRLFFGVGWTYLPFSDFRQLQPGDVVLLDECWVTSDNQIYLCAGQKLGLSAQLEDSRIVITGELEEIMYDDAEDEPDDEKILDGLQMRLSFDLGDRTMSLGELRQLAPGHVFELGRPVRRAVHIRANGKLIGEGELVDVDGQIAVSILNLTLDSV